MHTDKIGLGEDKSVSLNFLSDFHPAFISVHLW